MTAEVRHNNSIVSTHETPREAHDAAEILWRLIRSQGHLQDTVDAWTANGNEVVSLLFMNGRSTWHGLGQDRYGFVPP